MRTWSRKQKKNSLNLLHVTRNIWFTITTTTFAFLGVGPFLLFCFYSYHFTLNAEMQIKSFTSVMSSTFTDRVSLILSSYGWPIGWLSSVYSDMIAFNVKQQSKLLLSIFLTLFFFILGRIISENNWIYFTSWNRVYLYFTLEAY